MPLATQPLRDEHQNLMVHVEMLRQVADMVGATPVNVLRQRIDEAYVFLADRLIPHAQAEERALYPVVARLMGTADATATMAREHLEMARLTEELDPLRRQLKGIIVGDAQARAMRRVLYGLYVLVRVHLAKEEEIYLPILDAGLTPEEAQQVFQAMERATRTAKTHAGSTLARA